MVPKLYLTLGLLLLIGTIAVEAQRDGRRRSGRRKPTTEIPPPDEEPENEKKPQKLDAETEPIAKSSSSQTAESETNAPMPDKEPANGNSGGPPFIVPRGTRKPRPHVSNNGELRPRPTLPTFARKRGPKPQRREFKKNDDNSEVSTSSTTTTTTTKPTRGSSRNRNNNSQDRNSSVEKTLQANDEISAEAEPKKRFGGGNRRSRGNRRHNAGTPES